MYGQHPGPTPTFGGRTSNAYGQAPSFGQAAPGSWNTNANTANNDDKLGHKAMKDPLLSTIKWLKARSQKEKLYLGIATGFVALVLFYFVIEDHDTLFVLSELVHFVGIGVLAYKLLRKRNCGGLSLRSQELTAIFLVVRMFCSFMMEYDIHTLLDLMTLIATGGVIYALRVPLKNSYQSSEDIIHPAFIAGPCLLLAVFAHPGTRHNIMLRVLWAFCVYLEAVSVLPQLRMMQKAKVVEKFTAHYVFALGLSRFIACAHWILQILEGDQYLWQALGSGVWPVMVLVSEVVQTFILADFCYYYVKSFAEGSGVIQLPAGIV